MSVGPACLTISCGRTAHYRKPPAWLREKAPEMHTEIHLGMTPGKDQQRARIMKISAVASTSFFPSCSTVIHDYNLSRLGLQCKIRFYFRPDVGEAVLRNHVMAVHILGIQLYRNNNAEQPSQSTCSKRWTKQGCLTDISTACKDSSTLLPRSNRNFNKKGEPSRDSRSSHGSENEKSWASGVP